MHIWVEDKQLKRYHREQPIHRSAKQNTQSQEVDPEDEGDEYVVEIGAEKQSWLSMGNIKSAINFLKGNK